MPISLSTGITVWAFFDILSSREGCVDMAIKISSEITDVNNLGMHDFYLDSISDKDNSIYIAGNGGYPSYYRVEIQFFDVEYISCATYFDDTFRFRKATEQELITISENYLDHLPQTIYCFEEDLSRRSSTSSKTARKFFIVASHVEITISYHA